MTFQIKTFRLREIPPSARRFVVLDDDGLPYRAVEIDGKNYDEEGWRSHIDTEIPASQKERVA